MSYHDPLAPSIREAGLDMASVGTAGEPALGEALSAADCVVIVTDHSSYDWADVVERSRLIVDTRNAVARAGAAGGKVFKL